MSFFDTALQSAVPSSSTSKEHPGLRQSSRDQGDVTGDDGDLVLQGGDFQGEIGSQKQKSAPVKQIEVFLAGWVTEKSSKFYFKKIL